MNRASNSSKKSYRHQSQGNLEKNNLYSNTQCIFLATQPKSFDSSKNALNKKSKFHEHFASRTQLISSAFNPTMYVPPHLNSSQVFSCFISQCKQWSSRPSSTMKQTKKIDYDAVYNALERRYQIASPSRCGLKKWSCRSRIRDQVGDDNVTRYKFRKPYKLYVEQNSGTSMEQDSGDQYMPTFYHSKNDHYT